MEEVKKILDALNSALFQLRSNIRKADEARIEYENKSKELYDAEVEINKKTSDLNSREAKVSHIESVDKAGKDAKDLMDKARTELSSVADVRAKLDSDIKEHRASKVREDKEIADSKVLHLKEVDAVKKERKALEEGKKKFVVEQKVAKEMAS